MQNAKCKMQNFGGFSRNENLHLFEISLSKLFLTSELE